jgi:phosphatidylserine decarboxylase
MLKKLFILLQYILPQHLLSRLVGALANCRWRPLKNLMIRWFIQQYHVDIFIAEKQKVDDYATFNEFFTRKLKLGVRFLAASDIISPVDGLISQIGTLQKNKMIQAKNQDYTLEDLLAEASWANYFIDGQFATIYLSPKDYHRAHMPSDGQLIETIYVPGKLFSVNDVTTQYVPQLFARNERLICRFRSETLGDFVLIFVGAMIVAGIRTTWAGKIAPNSFKNIKKDIFEYQSIHFKKGDDLGCFEMGSTVILLFEKDKVSWLSSLKENQPILFGDAMN